MCSSCRPLFSDIRETFLHAAEAPAGQADYKNARLFEEILCIFGS
jgi:hypothetical protein